MKISEKAWIEYIERLARLDEAAGQKMADYIAAHGTGDPQALTAYAQALVQKYGEGTAELACQFYDTVAAASGVELPEAVPAPPASPKEVAAKAAATKMDEIKLKDLVEALVKQAGMDTTVKNAIRDGAEWAWVPHGDTCPFCITLASRGWQRASKKAIKGGHAQHIHAHCNCEYAVRFNSGTTLGGYDPDKYLDQYTKADGNINAMRRAHYARHKDEINAQKRAAYQLRQKNRGKKVFITDIAIDKVPKVTFNGMNQEIADRVQEAHKELLRFAKEQNDSNEVACLLNLTNGDRSEFIKGEQTSIDIQSSAECYHWLRSMPEKAVMLLHNHPGQSYFSDRDIIVFLENESIGTMSIVTNQGKIWTIQKTDRYTFQKAKEAFRECIKASNGSYREAVDEFLKNGYNYGIERS